MKKKWKYILKKRMKGVSILSIPHLLFLSPAHVWKIPCCHLLRWDVPSTNGLSEKKKTWGEEGEKRKGVRETEEEKGVEEREWGIETSSYNRLLGGVMKQLSDAFYFLLLSLLLLCLSSSVFSSSSPSPQLCLFCLLTLSYAFPFFSYRSAFYPSLTFFSSPLYSLTSLLLCLFPISHFSCSLLCLSLHSAC